MASLVALQRDCYENGDSMRIVTVGGFEPKRARKSLMKTAIQAHGDFDYVLMLDSDHTFSSINMYLLIETMEAEKLSILSAQYRARGDVSDDPVLAMIHYNDEGKLEKVRRSKAVVGLNDVEVIGLGFCVMKMDLLKDLNSKFEHCFNVADKPQWLDDACFSYYVKKSGYRLCFDSRIKIAHLTVLPMM